MFRDDYPRPQFVRENWVNLNGTWQFEFAGEKPEKKVKYFDTAVLDQGILVPFVYQSKLSGIENKEHFPYVWYKRTFDIPHDLDKLTILHFGAVDYLAKVYINGQFVGEHEGGHTSFAFDITEFLTEGEQILTVQVFDPLEDETILRGKQFWESESRGIWYTNSTGIWQTVWIEQINKLHIEKVKFTSDVDRGMVDLSISISDHLKSLSGERVVYTICFKGQKIIEDSLVVTTRAINRSVDLIQNTIFRTNFHDNGWLWSPEAPNLFDVKLVLLDGNGEVSDTVQSYFGFRKIHTEKGMVFLNNQPYYQKLVLDQGYWPSGLLTAPSRDDFEKDIRLSKEMGFNGCRKHQKVEDPLFYYMADTMGYLVWGECASAPVFTEQSGTRLMKEWMEIVERDYNHPSIVTWVPLNESWGVPDIHLNKKQQQLSETMYHMLHAIDGTRLVISNDGWDMTVTDICAIHNYSHGEESQVSKYEYFKESLATREKILNQPPSKWNIYAEGYKYRGEPILLTEFGGIGYQIGGQNGWGYTSVKNDKDFVANYKRIIDGIFESRCVFGFCYTQLTDVEQEINGMLSYDRTPKCDLALIREINHQSYLKWIEPLLIGNNQ